ncbi:HpcH/HpaI aldolase/citrate lyase family protein [Methylophilus methylotrophus]|uniref:HpcH/HpaI aldolase/citrate lyase family protein n=1 Tax=Methylophilus methylotrophus TaxID=17 RepID=UPI000369A970|nr:aldolase/citrate lyase family protein [Methylophilus methylotrophus]
MAVHPNQALFGGEKPFPVIPACEHFAGSEKLILKALSLQDAATPNGVGPVFDITCDCEDGAASGQEQAHAEMIVRVLNSEANKYRMAGARIHDYTHPHWKKDIDILVGGAGEVLSYLTIPKCTDIAQAREMIAYIQQVAKQHGISREIPVHILIETHGALRQVHEIAQLPWLQVLDFGLMDFVSAHHGAIPATAMRSPGQFDHRLLARAKAEVVSAALANGVVPAHNVTLDLKNVEVTYSDASRARNEFGFMRMWSIYPTQIQAIVDAMKPNYDEVTDAANILLAAQTADWGPIQYAGELHDRATYRYFWEVLQKAKQTGVAMPEDAEHAFF